MTEPITIVTSSRLQKRTTAVRMALIEMARYGRKVIWATKDGSFNCSLGPDGDLILTPVKPRCEITQAWMDEMKPIPKSPRSSPWP